MINKGEIYERKLRCVFSYNTKRIESVPVLEANGSAATLDKMIEDGDEFIVRQKLIQAKEQIKQLIQQGNDLRLKNRQLELDINETKTKVEERKNTSAENSAKPQRSQEINKSYRVIIVISCIVIMVLGIFMGKYIM